RGGVLCCLAGDRRVALRFCLPREHQCTGLRAGHHCCPGNCLRHRRPAILAYGTERSFPFTASRMSQRKTTMKHFIRSFLLLLALVAGSQTQAQEDISGVWAGSLQVAPDTSIAV